MTSLKNSLKLILSSKRFLKKHFRSWMPDMAYVQLEDGFRMYLSMVDVGGPSFDLGYDKIKAFYQYEKRDKDLIERHIEKAEVFLDVGANIGHFAFYFKRKFPRLVCHLFEPIPWLGNCINKTVEENNLTEIYYHAFPLMDRDGEQDIFIDTFNDGGHSLLKENISHRSRGGASLKVQSQRLDSMNFERVDFIKVDIQGAEKRFVKGAVETIKKFRPVMLVEVAIDKVISFVDFLEAETGLTYDIFLAGKDGPISRLQLQEMKKSERGERNFLFQM